MNFKLIVLLGLAVWNLIVFVFYALDKQKAVKHQWRIPEKTLLGMAVLAGGLGGLLAGKICHHKTKKWYFWLAWILGLLVDAALIYFILERI